MSYVLIALYIHVRVHKSHGINVYVIVYRIREQQLIATYHTELESINAQHRHKAQQLLTDFNKAKTLLTSKIHELERQCVKHYHYRNPFIDTTMISTFTNFNVLHVYQGR